jgi:two-component system, response regulator PdtaR
MGLNGAPRLVLIVEDEAMLRMDIADHFRAAGWTVLEADTAEDAIEFVRDGRRVDTIFTDIQLAGRLNGWDVGEQCRDLRKDVAVVYASGNAADRSRQVRGSLFFDKPYFADAVIEACHKLT